MPRTSRGGRGLQAGNGKTRRRNQNHGTGNHRETPAASEAALGVCYNIGISGGFQKPETNDALSERLRNIRISPTAENPAFDSFSQHDL